MLTFHCNSIDFLLIFNSDLEDLKNAQAQAQAQAQAVATSRLDSHYMDMYRMRYVKVSTQMDFVATLFLQLINHFRFQRGFASITVSFVRESSCSNVTAGA